MSFPIVHVNANPISAVKYGYYTGTDAVAVGTPLAYDLTVDTGNLGAVGVRGTACCKPTTASKILFGVAKRALPVPLTNVDDGGTVAPRFVEVEAPVRGQVTKALVKANCTKGVTRLTLSNGNNFFTLATNPAITDPNITGGAIVNSAITTGDMVFAIALETVDTSSAAAEMLILYV